MEYDRRRYYHPGVSVHHPRRVFGDLRESDPTVSDSEEQDGGYIEETHRSSHPSDGKSQHRRAEGVEKDLHPSS